MTTGIDVRTGPTRGLVQVSLKNLGKLNAMSRSMWRALRQAFVSLRDDAAVRCIVVRGDGAEFCAGGDISEYPGFRFDEAGLRDFHENDVWGALQAMLDCDVPMVACIEGHCMGAGMEIASCCDIRLAAANARFGAPIGRLGFPMAPREAALVAQQAGLLTAREMLLGAAVLDAPTMLSRGFLNHVFVPAEMDQHVEALAARICSLAPQAARMNKATMRHLTAHPVAAVMPELLPTPYSYADSPEHREGVSAFLDKRPPEF